MKMKGLEVVVFYEMIGNGYGNTNTGSISRSGSSISSEGYERIHNDVDKTNQE